MKRISERISQAVVTAVAGMECPGCHKTVVPRGESCPECDFPISRYRECDFPISRYRMRVKWFWVTFASVIGFFFGVFGIVLNAAADPHGLLSIGAWALAVGSIACLGLGLTGLAFGGRHTGRYRRQSSGWTPPPKAD